MFEKEARVPRWVEAPTERPTPPTPLEPGGWSSAAGYSTGLPSRYSFPAAATSRTPRAVAYSTARRSVDRGLDAAEAEIDDLGALVDRVDDRGGLVDVGERAVGAARLHDQQPGVAAEAGDALAVRDRAGRERGDERAVAVTVADVGAAVEDVVRRRDLGGEVGRGQVGAGVDDGDRDPAGGSEHGLGHGVGARRRPLPLVGGVGEGRARRCRRGQGRFRRRHAARRGLDEVDPGLVEQGGGEAVHRGTRLHLGHLEARDRPYEVSAGRVESALELRFGLVADDRRRRVGRRRECECAEQHCERCTSTPKRVVERHSC